jgi:hypothetical protein
MVALFLLAVISLLVLESYRAGLGIWEAGYGANGDDRRARTVVELLRRHLTSAHPARVSSAGASRLFFRGEARSVEFVSLAGMASSAIGGVPRAIRFATDESAGETGLRVEEYSWPRRDFPSESAESPIFSEKIGRIESIEFSYRVKRAASGAVSPASSGQPAADTGRTVDRWPGDDPATDEYLSAVIVSFTLRGGSASSGEISCAFELPTSDAWRREALGRR